MTNVTRLVMGPQNFTKRDHEVITVGKIQPADFVFLQPFEYCVINDPVMRDKDGGLIIDKHGQVKVKIGDSEIRTSDQYKEPFPLYPGETLMKREKMPVIPRNCALKLEALRDFVVTKGEAVIAKRVAGDEWLEFGPKIYSPQIEVKIINLIRPIIIEANQALKVRALRQTKDHKGKERNAGEEWLIRDIGFYIPGIDEQVDVAVVGKIINDAQALLLKAKQTFEDFYGIKRNAGELWLITNEHTSSHIVDVYEEYMETRLITILRDDEFCYIRNPKDEHGQN